MDLIAEYHLIKGGIELVKRRIEGQSRFPDYMFKALTVITRAYSLTAIKYYPTDLKTQTEVLRTELIELKDMFSNQQK